MIGAIIGDIVGSRFEYNNIKSEDFELFTKDSVPTDDTYMTLAVGMAVREITDNRRYFSDTMTLFDEWRTYTCNAQYWLRHVANKYPSEDYGDAFRKWLQSDNPRPYNSFGNGAAMRISAAGMATTDFKYGDYLALCVTAPTHNHPSAMRAACVVTEAIILANKHARKSEIRDLASRYYDMNFNLCKLRETYSYDVTCNGTVPEAIYCFLISNSFEDAIRKAISIGGDSDTLAAITGAIAEAYYGVPTALEQEALKRFDNYMLNMYNGCYKYNKII